MFSKLKAFKSSLHLRHSKHSSKDMSMGMKDGMMDNTMSMPHNEGGMMPADMDMSSSSGMSSNEMSMDNMAAKDNMMNDGMAKGDMTMMADKMMSNGDGMMKNEMSGDMMMTGKEDGMMMGKKEDNDMMMMKSDSDMKMGMDKDMKMGMDKDMKMGMDNMKAGMDKDMNMSMDKNMTMTDDSMSKGMMDKPAPQIAIFGAGCYWGTEHMFLKHYPPKENKGIISTSVGFINGVTDITDANKTTKGAGSVEACRVVFDPSIISYAELVEFFYRFHDPTMLNHQGNDKGKEYRSVIITSSDEQAQIARKVTAEIQAKHFDPKNQKLVTRIETAGSWKESSAKDQQYLQKNPNGVNNDLRLAERRREFNVDELCRLAAQSVGRSSRDINTFVKLAEGGFNRTFLITMHDGFEMVARIPYPITTPKFYTIASEVATMRFLRSSGLSIIPEVYDYSPSSDNTAKTEYIFMEYIRGTKLSDVWMELDESDIISVLRQLAQLESRMMSIHFPAGGSLYYTNDLAGKRKTGIPFTNERFCVGPDVRLHMWYGRRSQLEDVDRGPYANVEAVLVATARKELAYLEKFGRSILPFQRERRESYGYQEQSPSDHIKNLKRYLLIASSLVPKNPALHHFRICHPDLQPSNVIVSTSSDSKSSSNHQLKIVGLLDWQHALILPLFLNAGIPGRLQNYDDPVSQALIPPSLPANMSELDQFEQTRELGLYHRRFVHFHYVKNTEKYNKLHHDALSDFMSMFIYRLFDQAGAPWEDETHALKTTLIEATETWERPTGGKSTPCPIAFEPEDLLKTKELSAKLQLADENFEGCREMIGFETETWVSNKHYEMAMALAELLKLRFLKEIPDKELRVKVEANWFLNDMNEEDYM